MPHFDSKHKYLNPYSFYILLLPVIFFIPISGCTDPEISREYLSEEFKSWGNFKEGTYWIYKELNSGVEDSCYVYSYDSLMQLESYPDEGEYFIEVIESRFISSSLQDSFKIWMNTGGLFVNLENISSKSVGSEVVLKCVLVVPPPVQGQSYNTGPIDQVVTFDSIFETYSVGNSTFHDVVRANDNMNMAFNRRQSSFYTARNIGIVKKVFPEVNQTWELVRFSIVS